MPNYRRLRIAGATYFFTVNLADRSLRLLTDRADLLRAAFAETKTSLPFTIDAIVILPDHLHCLWTLPSGDSDFSKRWYGIKTLFSRRLGQRDVWQRGFWDHVVRDDEDYAAHVDYIHYNPVKHGHAARVAEWPYSSFHRFVRNGIYPAEWADGDRVKGSYGE